MRYIFREYGFGQELISTSDMPSVTQSVFQTGRHIRVNGNCYRVRALNVFPNQIIVICIREPSRESHRVHPPSDVYGTPANEMQYIRSTYGDYTVR